MPNPVNVVAIGLVKAVGAIGSLFVKVGTDGKLNVAIAPATLLLVFTTSITCAVQKSESFSTCVRDTTRSLKELVYAD